MPLQISRNYTTLGLATLAAVSFAIAGITAWWRKRQAFGRIPTEWKRVGEIIDIYCFPIKSCGVVRLNTAQCTILGLQTGLLRDRVFMVTDLKRRFVTARKFPKMTLIRPNIDGDVLTLEAPGMLSVSIDIKNLESRKIISSEVWGHVVKTIDCGEETATWLSRYILGEDFGLRLVFFPSNTPARSVPQNDAFGGLTEKDTGALTDASSFSLLAESSVADLNHRLEKEVTALTFRPNFVVRGTVAPYEEEQWDWIQVGEAVFRNVKPCTRCNLTTVDPETGTKDENGQPLKELKSYKKITEEKIKAFTGDSPVMGIHLGLRRPGLVKTGDSVYVGIE